MIVKATVYFNLKTEQYAKIENSQLLIDNLNKQLEEYLSGSSFKLSGSFWNDNRISAKPITRDEALNTLRTKK